MGLRLRTRNWLHRTSRCPCLLLQGRLSSLSLALRLSWSVYLAEKERKKEKLCVKYKHLSPPKGRLNTSFSLLSCAESPNACGITQFTPHLQHLAVSCCLAFGHDVPAVAVGDETAICCQESHFALRKQGCSDKHTKWPRSWCKRVKVVPGGFQKALWRAALFSDESW